MVDQKAIFILMLVGILIMAFGIAKSLLSHDGKGAVPTHPNETKNTSSSNPPWTAGPITTQNVEVYAYPPKPARVAAPATPKPAFSIVAILNRTTSINFFKDSFVADAKGYSALVVGFRNDGIAGKSAHSLHGVRAHVIYRDASGNELLDIPSACWLEEPTDSVDLEIGVARYLIVAANMSRENWVAPWVKKQKGKNSHGFDFVIDGVDIPNEFTIVEIRMIDTDNFSLPKERFEIKEIDGDVKMFKLA
ncbi:hypothetical protein RBB77_19625 [Tunturibacter psychrotolerans]|uniref:Uncharacterized protein n=1 Tax=Tunturiibacter psychrotolerans TaxID=3069686 RepID=A0AAU7ZNV6_9BACT